MYVQSRIYSSKSGYIAAHVGTEILYGKYTGFYTIATKEEKCENCSWMTIDSEGIIELQ